MSNRGRAIIAASLAFALGFGGVPAIAHADEPAPAAPATLDEAWATYGELSMKVAEVGESLNDTYYELGQAEQNKADLGVKIEASTARLDTAKIALGERVASNYKTGYGSLLDLILGADSFDSLISTMHYIDKLTQADLDCLEEVKSADAELKKEQAELTETEQSLRALAEQKEQQLNDLKGSLEKQQGYIAGLSEPLRAAFDEKQVSEIVAQQAAAVEALARQEANLAANNGGTSVAGGGDVASAVATIAQDTASAAEAPSTEAAAAPVSTGGSSSSGSSLSSDARSKILEAAYSQIGVQYVYGASNPGESFDCSGLTSWAYSQAGIDIPHSSAAQASMADNKSIDELQPGDLVFWVGNVSASQSGNHVAIYAGDGQIIHANGSVVTTGTLNDNWTSAGSIV